MGKSHKEIWVLCDFLEAELEGRPYDRSHALELAEFLGDKFPGIHQTMQQVRNRMSIEISATA